MLDISQPSEILDDELALALVLALQVHRLNPTKHTYAPSERISVLIDQYPGAVMWHLIVYANVGGDLPRLLTIMGEQTADGERILWAQGITPFEPWRAAVLLALRSIADGQHLSFAWPPRT